MDCGESGNKEKSTDTGNILEVLSIELGDGGFGIEVGAQRSR
jgi:hypothetical protein